VGKQTRDKQEKQCQSCNKADSVLFRIRVKPQKDWSFLCTACQTNAKTQTGYEYGGTWKQKKRN
jgi:hypothetical protein